MFKITDERMFTKYYTEYIDPKQFNTNNPIERYFREIRRRTKAIGCFESMESADRLIFLVVEYLNQTRGSMPTCPELDFTQ